MKPSPELGQTADASPDLSNVPLQPRRLLNILAAAGCKRMLGRTGRTPGKLVPGNQEQSNHSSRMHRERGTGVIANAQPTLQSVAITHLITQTGDAVYHLNKA